LITAASPRTSAGREFQRDIQNELTVEGIAAAEAEGRYRGRPPALNGDRREDVRAAFHEGASIAALARAHGVSRAAVRTALADLLPGQGILPRPSA
jgi:DNA invertase Pin-like site-specific DNA recombinase